jgi:hypothetical protein
VPLSMFGCGRMVVPTASTPLILYATMGCKDQIIRERARNTKAAAKAKAKGQK